MSEIWRRMGPDRWCRICRTWSGWWCWFFQPIDRPRRRACIWREGTPSPFSEKLNPFFSLRNVDLNLSNFLLAANTERERARTRKGTKWNERWPNAPHFRFKCIAFIYGSGNRQPRRVPRNANSLSPIPPSPPQYFYLSRMSYFLMWYKP